MDIQKEASKLFSPKPWKHDVYPGKEKYECDKCDKTWPFKGNDPCVLSERNCTIPDPIDITDLGLAIKTFREMDEIPYPPFNRICSEVAPDELNCEAANDIEQASIFASWLLAEATAEQIFEICIRAKEKSNDR